MDSKWSNSLFILGSSSGLLASLETVSKVDPRDCVPCQALGTFPVLHRFCIGSGACCEWVRMNDQWVYQTGKPAYTVIQPFQFWSGVPFVDVLIFILMFLLVIHSMFWFIVAQPGGYRNADANFHTTHAGIKSLKSGLGSDYMSIYKCTLMQPKPKMYQNNVFIQT